MKIEKISADNLQLVNKIDSTFTVNSKLKLNLTGNKFSYEIESVSPYKKTYEYEQPEYEQPEYSAYIDNNIRTVFFAFEEETLVGQMVILKYWNRYACINDIRIKDQYRGKGIGKALMGKAIEWAHEHNCVGVEAETQDINVKACLFYERLGLTLGGVDLFRYKSSEKEKDEIALNWYLLL